MPSSSTSGCIQNGTAFQLTEPLLAPSSSTNVWRLSSVVQSHGRQVAGKGTPLTTANCASKKAHATVPGPFGLSTLLTRTAKCSAVPVQRHDACHRQHNGALVRSSNRNTSGNICVVTETPCGGCANSAGLEQFIRTDDSGSKRSSYGPGSAQGLSQCVSDRCMPSMHHVLSQFHMK